MFSAPFFSLPFFSLLCMFLFAVIGVFWWIHKKIGLPKRGPFGRIAVWAEGVRTSEAEVKTATVGDLVLFVTLYVIGVTFVVTLYLGINQSAEDKRKIEADQSRDRVNSLETELRDQQDKLAQLREGRAAPQLVTPTADEQIIGAHVDFRWDYSNHNETASYVVEVMRIAAADPTSGLHSDQVVDGTGQIPVGKPCLFAATDSSSQRARLFGQRFPGQGTYIWRVAVGELANAAQDGGCSPDDDKIRVWSSYRKFTLFPSRIQRVRTTHEILVGTGFLQNLPFSRTGSDGKPTGFEIDLVKMLVKGCLVEDARGIHYDREQCTKAVRVGTPPPQSQLDVRIVPIPTGTDWKDELQRRNIDLYVGALTRAKKREHGDIMFTDGYLTYETELLVDKNESCPDIVCLAGESKKIGVVENSTNEWLAGALKQERELDRLKIVPYRSFPDLENAFEKQDVDAVITDGVMRSTMGLIEPRKLTDLKKRDGWEKYLGDNNFIGYQREEFGMAVVSDIDTDPAKDPLRVALNCALQSSAIQGFMRSKAVADSLESIGARVAPPGRECK